MMENRTLPIISAEGLKLIINNQNVVVIDSSYPKGKQTFKKEHLVGARFVDLDIDLADIKSDFAHGGRHPLPQVSDFVSVLNDLGISNNTHIIVYDRNTGAFAARMWWMLRAIGHEKVQVLDGGFDRAKKLGLATDTGDESAVVKSNYSAKTWLWSISEMADIEAALISNSQKVIDVRGAERYRGEVEPIDIIAGHIPGAINAPFTDNLLADGTFKSKQELKDLFSQVLGNGASQDAIFHCGSGVTACHSILALDIAGRQIPSLYVGSWSEWSRNYKPITTDM